MTSYHVGRSWNGNQIERECPCPLEPCGLVNLSHPAPNCTEHTFRAGKTMRQGHPAADCPATKESNP